MADFTLFSDMLTQAGRAGMASTKSQASRDWLRSKAMETTRVRELDLLKQRDRFAKRLVFGKMYLFSYNPKTKNDLPFYDRLPLIFPFSSTGDSFYGINLHYLPYVYRAKLMDALYSLASDQRYDENTKLKISYEILNRSARFRYFKPCVKQYLNSHVQSRLINIYADEWDMALFLPLERFQKASKQQVFKETTRQLRR